MVLHNPNNWHWVDKNCIYWSREYFAEKLVGISTESSDKKTTAKITKLKSLEGDVDVCQRKGKVISLFDLRMELNYEGETVDSNDEKVSVTGQVNVPEIAYDTEADEYTFTITINSDSSAKEPVKTLVRKDIVPQLRKILSTFGKDLIDTHGTAIQHADQKSPVPQKLPEQQASTSSSQDTNTIVGTQSYNTVALNLEPAFHAPAAALYDAFTKPDMVAAWTRSKPDIDATPGKPYSLFGGNVTGKILEVKPNERLQMTWRLREWKPDHVATLTLDFVPGPAETKLKVNWTGIPIGQEEVVESNFNSYYVTPIKVTFGFGAVL